jgi:hypothetical protein
LGVRELAATNSTNAPKSKLMALMALMAWCYEGQWPSAVTMLSDPLRQTNPGGSTP